VRFVELRDRVQTVADIAQTLEQELADTSNSEFRFWAEAARTCVETHIQDAKILLPWLRLEPAEVLTLAESPSGRHPNGWQLNLSSEAFRL